MMRQGDDDRQNHLIACESRRLRKLIDRWPPAGENWLTVNANEMVAALAGESSQRMLASNGGASRP